MTHEDACSSWNVFLFRSKHSNETIVASACVSIQIRNVPLGMRGDSGCAEFGGQGAACVRHDNCGVVPMDVSLLFADLEHQFGGQSRQSALREIAYLLHLPVEHLLAGCLTVGLGWATAAGPHPQHCELPWGCSAVTTKCSYSVQILQAVSPLYGVGARRSHGRCTTGPARSGTAASRDLWPKGCAGRLARYRVAAVRARFERASCPRGLLW